MNFVEYDEPILELVQELSRFGECEAVGLTRAGQRNGGLSGQGGLNDGELAAGDQPCILSTACKICKVGGRRPRANISARRQYKWRESTVGGGDGPLVFEAIKMLAAAEIDSFAGNSQ